VRTFTKQDHNRLHRHTVSEVLPSGEDAPGVGHDRQVVPPVVLPYVRTGQLLHAERPVVQEYVPAVQSVHNTPSVVPT
jgi:hypothetical protein